MKSLTPVMESFILRWGEIGGAWGLNRTVAQIYALLYLSDEPLNAEEICEALSLARSTVSASLRELLGWGVIHIAHALGDRRDYFETIGDVWEMFRVIVRERKSREMDPLLHVLRETLAETDARDEPTKEKLKAMLEFFEAAESVYQQVDQLPTNVIMRLARMGQRFGSVLKTISGE
jgi:DNA-binding transcriptional regulator GbsR (MarR family)